MGLEQDQAQKQQQHSHLYSEIYQSSQEAKANVPVRHVQLYLRRQVLRTLARDPLEFASRKTGEVQRKLDNKPLLLDNPESKRLKRRRKIKCSSNVLRSVARHALDAQTVAHLAYGDLISLHRLWEGYMSNLAGMTQRTNLANALLRADYHGAHLRVVQSRCPSMVNKYGLVVQETMQTFVLMQPDNRAIVVPKAGNVFACEIVLPGQDRLEWHLFGDQLRQHSGLRSSKKFKSKFSVSL